MLHTHFNTNAITCVCNSKFDEHITKSGSTSKLVVGIQKFSNFLFIKNNFFVGSNYWRIIEKNM